MKGNREKGTYDDITRSIMDYISIKNKQKRIEKVDLVLKGFFQ